jgi:procollagen-lysine,2-oxoglutarate 5-dioxygenase
MLKEKLHYITIATKPHRVLNKIIENVKKNGETIEVLGLSENRLIGWEGHQNFGVKLREMYNFIHRPSLNQNDIVLFTDAYDVAYLGTQKDILRRYKMFSKPIIFGAERSCHPDPDRASQYNYLDTEFPFLNSGMIIGKVSALKKCMKDYQFDDRHDDQRFWTTIFFENQNLIELDYENLLFLNAADIDMEEFDFSNNQVWYKSRNPHFVHINGPDKSMIEIFLHP